MPSRQLPYVCSEHLKSYLNRTYSTDVEIYVPRHDIADEYEQRLRRGEQPGSTVTHIYGRRGLEKQVPALCSRYEYVQQLEMAGVSVYRNACFRSGTEICDSYNSCAYIAQFRDDGGYSPLQNNVRIYQHVSLALPRNRLESEPNIVIVDEAFLIFVKEYYIDPESKEVSFYRVKEMIRGDPIFMRIVADKRGVRGGRYKTCLIHRDQVKTHAEDDKCEICSLRLQRVSSTSRALV